MADSNQTVTVDNHDKRKLFENVLYAIFLFIIMEFSIIGNIAVIIATVKTPRLYSQVSNLFLINLAVTDLSNSVLVMHPSFIALVMDDWYLGWITCQLQCGFNYIFIIVSMVTLAFISIDRYIAIVHSFKYPMIIKRNRVRVSILFTWVQGLVFAIAPIIMDWVHYDYWEMVCAIDWFSGSTIVIYVILANIFCFMVPGGIIVFAYSRIIKETNKLKSRVVNFSTAQDQHSIKAAKTIRSLLIVVVIFFICMAPFCLTKLFKAIFYNNPTAVPGHLNSVSALVQYLSSATNPLIYGIFRKDFRAAFIRQLQYIGICQDYHYDDDSSQIPIRSRQVSAISETMFIKNSTTDNTLEVKDDNQNNQKTKTDNIATNATEHRLGDNLHSNQNLLVMVAKGNDKQISEKIPGESKPNDIDFKNDSPPKQLKTHKNEQILNIPVSNSCPVTKGCAASNGCANMITVRTNATIMKDNKTGDIDIQTVVETSLLNHCCQATSNSLMPVTMATSNSLTPVTMATNNLLMPITTDPGPVIKFSDDNENC